MTEFPFMMDEGLLQIKCISSKDILSRYWNTWLSLSKSNKECLMDYDIFKEREVLSKKVDFCTQNEEKCKKQAKVNLIDLNKNILLNCEIETLRNYWDIWRRIFKAKQRSKLMNISCKRIILYGQEKIENAVTCFSNPLRGNILKENDNKLKYKYLNLWKLNTKHNSIHTTVIKNNKMMKVFRYTDQSISEDTAILIDANNCSFKKYDKDMLRNYWNLWRENIKPNTLSVPLNKIDIFLSAIEAKKMKTVKKCRSHLTLVASEKENKKHRISNGNISLRGNCNIEQENSTKETTKIKGFSKLSLNNHGDFAQTNRSPPDNNITISSLKNDAKLSLKRAHSLLETTIASSFSSNCTRRKNFNHHIRKGSPIPMEMPDSDFLERMKIREMERMERWQKSKDRRQHLENEKNKNILELEKEKIRQMELSKKLVFQKIKEKKLQEIEHQKNLEEMKQKYLEQNSKALVHYNRKLLHNGMNGFMHALHLKNEHVAQAIKHHNQTLLLKKFNEWRNIFQINEDSRLSIARNFYLQTLKRSCFYYWTNYHKEFIFNMQTAIDFYEMKVQEIMFSAWNQHICDIIVEEISKTEFADLFYRKNLLKKCFSSWKRLPAILRKERAKGRIKRMLRKKVLEVIPDFCPAIEDDE